MNFELPREQLWVGRQNLSDFRFDLSWKKYCNIVVLGKAVICKVLSREFDSYLTLLIHNFLSVALTSDITNSVQLENPSQMEIKAQRTPSFVNWPGKLW